MQISEEKQKMDIYFRQVNNKKHKRKNENEIISIITFNIDGGKQSKENAQSYKLKY